MTTGRSKRTTTFTAKIGKITVLRVVIVPPKVVRALGGALRIPVIARYGGVPTQTTLAPAGGGKRRLTLKLDVLKAAGVDAGDTIRIELSPDPNPRFMVFPPDLQRALQ